MTTIEMIVDDQSVTVTSNPVITSGEENTVKIHVDFSEDWTGFGKTAVFFTEKDKNTLYEKVLTNGDCIVPSEVIANEGSFIVGFRGVNSTKKQVKTTALVKYSISKGTPAVVEFGPTPDVYEQILGSYEEIITLVNNLEEDLNAKGVTIRYNSVNDTIQILDESGAWHDWANGELVNHFLIKNGNLVSECNFAGTPETIQKEGEFGIGSTGTFMRFALNMMPYKGNYLKIVARRDYNGTDLGEPIGISRIDDYTNPSLVEGMHSISVVEEWSTFYLLIEDIFNETNPYLQLTFIDNVGYWIKTIAITSENGTEGGGSSDDVELTQAEYDALPDTKLTDNKNYFIKDGKGGGSGSGYSETLLFDNTEKKYNGTFTLTDSFLNYDQIVFEVTNNNSNNWDVTSFCPYLVSAISDRIGGQSEAKGLFLVSVASAWLCVFLTTETSITTGEGGAIIKRIYGIKY